MKPTSVLSDSFYFFGSNAAQIALASFPFLAIAYAAQLVVTASVDSSYEKLVSPIVGLLTYPLYTAASILAIAKRSRGEAVVLSRIFNAALRLWWPLFLQCVVLAVVLGVGLLLLVVPGIWLGTRLSLSEIYLVLSERKPLEALRASFQSTKPHFSSILTTLILAAIPLWLLSFGVNILFRTIGNNYPLAFIAGVFGMFIGLFINVVLFRMFMLTAYDNEA